MKTLILATSNPNKKKEIKKILKGMKIKVVLPEDIGETLPMVLENGTTFRQNAIKKAVTVSGFLSCLVLADDSGLEANSLGGKPGVRSARFARAKATDQENNKKLMTLMKNVPKQKRGASFVCSIALADNGFLIKTVEGRCAGRLTFEGKGENGFGYDPFFKPMGSTKTFAEMTAASKNKISHRAKALQKMREAIVEYLEKE